MLLSPLPQGEGVLGVFWLYLLLGDFRLRPFGQIDFKGGQYLTNEQIVPSQARNRQVFWHAKAIPHSVERRIAYGVAESLGLASALGAVSVPGRAEERAGRIFTVLYTPAAVSCIIPSQRISTPGGGRSDE